MKKSKMGRRSIVSKTMCFPLATFAMIEELCNKSGYQNYEECITKILSKEYFKLGLGLP